MDIYHIWADLEQGVSDTEFADSVTAYLSDLRQRSLIAGFRLTRRKLGLGAEGLGEFHIQIELDDLAQLDRAFGSVAERSEPIEGLHHAVNSKVRRIQFALYRDFPDPDRVRGEERF